MRVELLRDAFHAAGFRMLHQAHDLDDDGLCHLCAGALAGQRCAIGARVRVTERVGMGSLCAANPSATRAVASSIPAISKRMRPGFTTDTQRSGAPLPLPMRVSAGFLVKGLSGKMRIHNLPPRLMKRVMATREASIWRSEIGRASCRERV